MKIKLHCDDSLNDAYTIDVVTLYNECFIKATIAELNNIIAILIKLKEK